MCGSARRAGMRTTCCASGSVQGKAMKRTVNSNPNWCHICGLRIPDDIASANHPLFGTVDHVVPKSLTSMPKLPHNKLPAHRLCNSAKGSTYPIERNLRLTCHERVLRILTVNRTWLRWCSPRQLHAAKTRVHLAFTYTDYQLIQWQDDGGANA